MLKTLRSEEPRVLKLQDDANRAIPYPAESLIRSCPSAHDRVRFTEYFEETDGNGMQNVLYLWG